MEDELVLVKEKYVACNERNSQLEKELDSLRQDYQAIVHQPYFVSNLCFSLPSFDLQNYYGRFRYIPVVVYFVYCTLCVARMCN